jgi:mono/diheme cytochrome c family protein
MSPDNLIRPGFIARMTAVGVVSVIVSASMVSPAAEDGGAVDRGEYVFRAAGCHACHTDTEGDGQPLAGGRPFDTPFGRFYSPNITPHPEHGIGSWSAGDLWQALTEGEGPGGTHYYPVFPFPSYAAMTRSDANDLHAYLMSVTPVAVASREHDLPWYLSWRLAARIWKWMFLEEGTFEPTAGKSETWNRGAYLVRALGHCGECHTPRGSAGNLLRDQHLAGNPEGPDGDAVPGIRSDTEEGLDAWSESEIATYLKSGEDPDFDFAGGEMVTVIEDSTSHLTDEDRAAIATYLKDL